MKKMNKIQPLFESVNDNQLEDISMYHVQVNNDDLINKYKNIMATRDCDFKKARWSYEHQMYLRFEMAQKVIDFSKINSWCDVGCGCGNFFELILKDHHNIEEITGIDVVDSFVDIASNKNKQFKNVKQNFYAKNLYELDPAIDGTFDLVSCSGLLQMLDFDKIYKTFEKLSSIVKPGGSLWVDTFNYHYPKTKQRRRQGLWQFKHEDFEHLYKINGFENLDCNTFNSKLNINENGEGLYIYAFGTNKIV
jgi:ubiquinone/menaquinone biosynthesis C-methylase UbiE